MSTIESTAGRRTDAEIEARSADRITSCARNVFDWDDLRPGILSAVAPLLEGEDVLAVLPTGYGKSAVYRIAGALLPGTTIVVSPLIALQADQMAGLEATEGTRPAAAINSSQSAAANDRAMEELLAGRLGYLFLSPEQFADDELVDRIASVDVALLAVDEAHCLSSWGHDFRPDYLRLGEVADRLGRPPIVALTATGSRPVREEILSRLGMTDARVLTRGYDRPNIALSVRRHESDGEKVDALIDEVVELGTATRRASGLVYVATTKETRVISDALADRGLRAVGYHGRLASKRRREVQDAFRSGDVDVVVATSAFGMGIDRADVRFVVHADIPESVDAYYQEIGRAGRDGEPALAVLHYREEDLGLRRFFAATVPRRSALVRLLEALAGQSGAAAGKAGAAAGKAGAADIAEAAGMSRRRVTALSALLEDVGAVRRDDDRLAVTAEDRRSAAAAAVDLAESRRRVDESRIAMMRSYAETSGCRRQFLLSYFGDEATDPCGNCDTCASGSADRHEETRRGTIDAPFSIDDAVRHGAWGEGVVMDVQEERLTVFFPAEGYKMLALADVVERGLLEQVAIA